MNFRRESNLDWQVPQQHKPKIANCGHRLNTQLLLSYLIEGEDENVQSKHKNVFLFSYHWMLKTPLLEAGKILLHC